MHIIEAWITLCLVAVMVPGYLLLAYFYWWADRHHNYATVAWMGRFIVGLFTVCMAIAVLTDVYFKYIHP